jgi:hypothetical protein
MITSFSGTSKSVRQKKPQRIIVNSRENCRWFDRQLIQKKLDQLLQKIRIEGLEDLPKYKTLLNADEELRQDPEYVKYLANLDEIIKIEG